MSSKTPEVTSSGGSEGDTVVFASDDPRDVHLEYVRRGWTDGLPCIPATRERVDEMLQFAPASDEAPRIPPRETRATPELLAIQAVMAGCLPEQFPVVVAAIKAMTTSRFNLTTIQGTTHSAAPFILVNGPRSHELGFHGGAGCLGPGFQANATVGRAVRLALLNIGGGHPGVGDKATQGHPGKFTYCCAENERDSPWPPFQTDRGFSAEENTVTVFGAGAPINVNDHAADSAVHILDNFAETMSVITSPVTYRIAYGDDPRGQSGEWVVAFAPEHAQTIAAEGWTKDDVRRYLFEHARIPTGKLPMSGMWGQHEPPKWLSWERPGYRIPVVCDPESIAVTVIGGSGKHSSCIPTHGSATRSVTVAF